MKKIVEDFETFKLIIKDYDITKSNSPIRIFGTETKEIDLSQINKKKDERGYIKPYEKNLDF